MRYNNDLQRDAALDYYYEMQERAKWLDSVGLCHRCEENPQNPEIKAPICLDCNQSLPGKCEIDGCLNSSHINIRQSRFCDTHAIDWIHECHEDAVQEKIETLNEVHKWEKKLRELGEDPEKRRRTPYREMSDEIEAAYRCYEDARAMLHHQEHIMHLLKAAEKLNQAFPFGYSTDISDLWWVDDESE